MPDDRSSGFFGGSGFVRFSSADHSGSVSRIPEKKRSKDENQQNSKDEEKDSENNEIKESEFVDRSAQLRATLNSLAALNFVNVIKPKDKKHSLHTEKE